MHQGEGTTALTLSEQRRAAAVRTIREDPAVDMFSFGVTAFVVLTGLAPWGGERSVASLYQAIVVDRSDMPGAVPEWCGVRAGHAELVRTCMRYDPRERPSALRVCEMLDQLIEGLSADTSKSSGQGQGVGARFPSALHGSADDDDEVGLGLDNDYSPIVD